MTEALKDTAKFHYHSLARMLYTIAPDFCWLTKRELYDMVLLAGKETSWYTFNSVFHRLVEEGWFKKRIDPRHKAAGRVLPEHFAGRGFIQYLFCRKNPIDISPRGEA